MANAYFLREGGFAVTQSYSEYDHMDEDTFQRLRLTVRFASRHLSDAQVVTLADDHHAVRRGRRKGDPLSESPIFLDIHA